MELQQIKKGWIIKHKIYGHYLGTYKNKIYFSNLKYTKFFVFNNQYVAKQQVALLCSGIVKTYKFVRVNESPHKLNSLVRIPLLINPRNNIIDGHSLNKNNFRIEPLAEQCLKYKPEKRRPYRFKKHNNIDKEE